MSIFRSIHILFMVALATGIAQGQSDLQVLLDQKEDIVKQISKSKEKINVFSQDISSTTLKLSAIQRQIKLKNDLIKKRNQEIKLNSKIIKIYQVRIDSLEWSLSELKTDYKSKANGLYLYALKNKGKLKMPTLSLNQSTLKDIYARQYHDVCQDQADTIQSQLAELSLSKEKQEIVLTENKLARTNLQKEKAKFNQENKKIKGSISKLKSKKSSLKKELKQYNTELKNLESSISKVIRSSQKKDIDLALSGQFGTNKGLFRSPVSSGHIVSSFGEQPHPIITNVKIFNNGIDLIGPKSAEISTLYDGQVISIQEIPGSGLAIIIQHGEYYTVYSKLIKAMVQIGDQVKTNQHIGNISTLAGENILHFEIWKNQKRLDPELWINF